jgi:hypothetical protein
MRKYREDMAVMRRTGFFVRNIGSVTARDVLVEIHAPKKDGVQLLDAYEVPREPSTYFSAALASQPIETDVFVSEYDSEWVATIKVGKLQPKAEFWTYGHLYVATRKPQELEMTARVFGDNIPQPIEIPLRVRVKVEERIYRASDFQSPESA